MITNNSKETITVTELEFPKEVIKNIVVEAVSPKIKSKEETDLGPLGDFVSFYYEPLQIKAGESKRFSFKGRPLKSGHFGGNLTVYTDRLYNQKEYYIEFYVE